MAENKKYYWLKLKDNFFTDKRIKKLRKIAGGDTYTIIYLKMQLLSLQDRGDLYFENIEDTFEEEIALQIDEDVEDVKITIAYLLRCGLLIQKNNVYELLETKNCIGSETKNAESMRKMREKRKQGVTLLQDVTKCYTEKEIEKEIEIEIDDVVNINKKINISDSCEDGLSTATAGESCEDSLLNAKKSSESREGGLIEELGESREGGLMRTKDPSESREGGLGRLGESCEDGLVNKDLQEIIEFYNNNINLATQFVLETFAYYLDSMGKDLIILAMQKSVESNVKTIKYIKGILNSWSKKGIKTVLQAREEEQKYQSEKSIKSKQNKFNNYEQRDIDFNKFYVN